MRKTTQLSAWVEDRPGMLGRVADALGEKGVNIRAFTAAAMGGRGFVRVVVDRPAAAKKVFTAHGWRTAEDPVLEVTIADKPGALGAVADRLGLRGVNIEYAYLGTAKSSARVNLYLAVSDLGAAMRALRG